MDRGWTRKWKQSRTPGVRYREHRTRKHGVKRDRYFAIYYKVDGKRKEEGLGWASNGWTESKAAKVLSDLKAAQRTGQGPQSLAETRQEQTEKRKQDEEKRRQQKQDSITYGEVFHLYLDAAKSFKESWQREEQLFRLWIDPAIGARPMRDIVPLHLETIRKAMRESGLKERSFEYCYAVIRQVFNYANRNRIFEGTCPKVDKAKFDNRRTRFLTHDEADRLLEALGERSEEVRDIAALSLYTGMRAGEVFGLKWGDVDFDRGLLTLRDTKNSETRTVFLNDTTRSIFDSRGGGEPEALVFPDGRGNRQVQISKTFQRTVDALGLNAGVTDPRNRVCFHTLRHTHASWLVEIGTPLYTVKECLGHKSISMTERYSHLSQKARRDAVALLDRRETESIKTGPIAQQGGKE